jgi:hypothetical protein
MQRTLISAAIAAGFTLAAGQAGAQAITPAQMAAVSAANTLFISGATAPQQTLIDNIQLNVCNNTFTRLRSTSGNSARYQAWGCTSGGTQVAIYYSTLGSSWGVQPVLFSGGRNTPRIDPTAASCGAVAAGGTSDSCTVNGITASIPDVGVSDIRPSGFVAPNLPSIAQLAAEFPELASGGLPTATYAPVFTAIATPFGGGGVIDLAQGVVFGIAVNNVLGALLQSAQGLTVTNNVRDNRAPGINKTVVSGILSGSLADADSIDIALGVDTSGLAGPNRYVVCRRVPTSGTQAWANVYWLRNGSQPAADVTAAPGANSTDWGSLGKDVIYASNVTGGNVRACMNRATSSGIPAIGIISAENDNNAGASPGGTANTWSFAKLDGIPMEASTNGTQANNLTNAKNGTYDNVGEVTLNRRAAFTGVKNTMYTSLLASLRGSAVCTVSGALATGAVQIAGVGSDNTCKTVWTRDQDPFTTGKRK